MKADWLTILLLIAGLGIAVAIVGVSTYADYQLRHQADVAAGRVEP